MFESKTAFSLHIESLVKEHECTYTEALIYFAEISGAEYEDMSSMMSPCLIEKVRLEAQERFLLPKETTVSIDEEWID